MFRWLNVYMGKVAGTSGRGTGLLKSVQVVKH